MSSRQIAEVVALENACKLNSRGEESYSILLQNPHSILIVATDSAQPQAQNPIVAIFSGWIVADELEIDNIAVAENYRQKGVGRKLLQRALMEAKQKGAVKAFLEVRTGNITALKLYKKSGFTAVGRRPAYYRNPVEDAVILALNLQNGSEIAP